ncbi:hypothetical protein PYCC9005_001834 [Savitreella phatthalungensis]
MATLGHGSLVFGLFAQALSQAGLQLLICVTCGTQYDTAEISTLNNKCKICEDPRQFVPPTGQAWTTLGELRRGGKHSNIIRELRSRKLFSITTVPQFAIGQRALFVKGDHGHPNVLWDCITLLDIDTTDWIHLQGGLGAIAISHPHFYSAAVEWADEFACPIYIFGVDQAWVMRASPRHELISGDRRRITDDLEMVRIGGHFDGSAVLVSKRHKFLLTGDTLLVNPGCNRVTMMWSVPNMVPLPSDWIADVAWRRLNALDFDAVYALKEGMQIEKDAKSVVRDSLQLYVEKSGSFKELGPLNTTTPSATADADVDMAGSPGD